MGMATFGGKVAIITGGASGIGRALGRELSKRGAQVVLADRQIAAAQDAAAQIRSDGGQASAVELDVRDAAAFMQVAESVEQSAGGIDLLFNNAGIAVGGPMHDYDRADWDDVLDVNIRGVAYGIQAVYPRMVRRGRGHIINTASVAGLLPASNAGSYSMSKFAVVGVSRALRLEGQRHGVNVSVLCPGVIRTPILTGGAFGRMKLQASKQKMLELWEKFRPMDPAAFAEQVIDAVARNEPTIIVPRWWKLLWLMDRFAPSLSNHLWLKLADTALAQLAADGEKTDAPAERGNGSRAHAPS